MPSTLLTTLKKATKGLLYTSESDAPFTAFSWKAQGEPTAPQVLQLAHKPASSKVEEQSLSDFFRELTQEEDWFGPEEKADVEKYRHLQELLEQQLSGTRVFKVGDRKKDIYLVGQSANGEWAGVRTQAVET